MRWSFRMAATCAPSKPEDWLEAGGITTGPIFRPVSRSGRVRGRDRLRMIGDHAAVLPDLDPVGIGAKLDRAPDRARGD